MTIYGDQDPREVPHYTIGEAARYLGLATATLSSWIKGRRFPKTGGLGFSGPLIELWPDAEGRLTFNNLVEAHVLRALRTRHGVPMHGVRTALDYARDHLGIARPLISKKLMTVADEPGARGAGAIFVERLGAVENISASGQLVIRRALARHLERLEWDDLERPSRLFPFVPGQGSERSIVIDPRFSFGKPILAGQGVRVATLADRFSAGESVEHLAENYGIDAEDIEAALEYYERAA
jgi:uncharacterized protein (DUF433 family)